MSQFTGVQVVEGCSGEQLAAIYRTGAIPAMSAGLKDPYPNSFVVLKANGSHSAVARVTPDGQSLALIKPDSMNVAGLKPRNKEQAMLLTTLLDDAVPVQIITGKAGTGKTLIAMAAAMQMVEEKRYDRIILTKPMSQVGKYDLGILPGTIEEKFGPFLINYASNIEFLLNSDGGKSERQKTRRNTEQHQGPIKGVVQDFFSMYNVEMVPIQVLRGASFHKAIIIADEIQVLPQQDILTIGTRVAEGSKLILMGDLDQRDDAIARESTGLHKAIHNETMKKSGLVSYIELRKVERGPVAELFARVFGPEDNK